MYGLYAIHKTTSVGMPLKIDLLISRSKKQARKHRHFDSAVVTQQLLKGFRLLYGDGLSFNICIVYIYIYIFFFGGGDCLDQNYAQLL